MRTRNYLRMRGEEADSAVPSTVTPELPPHARRRAVVAHQAYSEPGITSACAEKSQIIQRFPGFPRNYLRMRGEEPRGERIGFRVEELPPHARRRDCVTCENFSGQRRFVTLQPIRSRVTTCRPSLLYVCAVDQECSQRILALDWNHY